ncbi:MAG: mechanosensitive ion channel [Anaerolineae bacterium]|nr:mechanosensitive ion channel [Anaerolineae bacterium]
MDLQASLETLLTSFLVFLPKLITAIVILVATFILASVLSKWVDRTIRLKPKADETVVALITKVTRALVIVFGVVLALEQVDFNVTGFIAGLGIAGFTVGFALQDITRNFIAGVIMLIYRPFSIGDSVKVAEYTGEVLDITLRDTVIKSWDGEKIILPNNNVFNAAIINYSDLPLRRKTISVVLSPDEEIGRTVAVFENAVENVAGVLSDPAVTVQLDAIGDNGLILSIRYWVDQTKSSLVQTHSDAVQAIQQTAKAAKISMPSPVQWVHIENSDKFSPENVT